MAPVYVTTCYLEVSVNAGSSYTIVDTITVNPSVTPVLTSFPNFAVVDVDNPNVILRIRKVSSVVTSTTTNTTSTTTSSTSTTTNTSGTYCGYGPNISTILQITPTQLTLQFDGGGVEGIAWRIKDSDSLIVREGQVTPTSNIIVLNYATLSPANYTVEIEGSTCLSISPSIAPFTLATSTSTTSTSSTSTTNSSTTTTTSSGYFPPIYGAYSDTQSGRLFTHNKNPKVVFTYNADGTITDTSPGLSYDGTTNLIDGKRRYYQMGGHVWRNLDGSYNRFQNIYLPDGLFTIHVFDCEATQFPNVATFISQRYYVRSTNAIWNDYLIYITSTPKVSETIVQTFVRFSRAMLSPLFIADKDWSTYNKWQAFCIYNVENSPTFMKAKGLVPSWLTNNDFGAPTQQTSLTRQYQGSYPSNTDLYNHGYGSVQVLGDSKKSVLADEIPENQWGGGAIVGSMHHFYRGAMDRFNAVFGPTNVGDVGLFGSYGLNQDVFGVPLLRQPKNAYIQGMTTYLYEGPNGSGGYWGVDPFYSAGDINYRNHNLKQYTNLWPAEMPGQEDFIYIMFHANERYQLGVRTYGGTDRTRRLIYYTYVHNEDLSDNTILTTNNGDEIPFPNGTFRHDLSWGLTASSAQEQYVRSFFGTLILDGVYLWDPGFGLASNPDRISYFNPYDDDNKWTPTAGSQGNYSPGVNGAPLDGGGGIQARKIGPTADAVLAGIEAAWDLRNYWNTNIKWIAYTSSATSGFTPVGGAAGMYLNGHGPINTGSYDIWDIVNQKKGIALEINGSSGTKYVYYNPSRPEHVTEDVTIAGITKTVYGRQIVIFG